MTDEIQSQSTSSTSEQLQKSDASPSEIELLTTLVKSQQDQISTIAKDSAEKYDGLLKAISDLKKMDANPVDHGATKEEKPKVSDNDDAGGAVKDEPSYAPDGDAQASIRAPADEAPKTDSVKVSKSDDEDGEKKEAKSEDKDEDMKKSVDTDMRKSISPSGDFEYEMVKAVRPKYDLLPTAPTNAPTGYQVMKAMFNGWNGKFTNFEKSFIHGYERLLKGEYGTGFPEGVV